jgi:RNA polymerase sigma factor (sigma-70 family)
MLRLARRMVADDADDAAHDAWLRTQGQETAGPRADAYLRTAIRWARDMQWRSDARRRQREQAVGVEDSEGARVELVVAMTEALAALSPVDRELVWRRHVDGRSPDEISEATGLRADAVRQRVLRALRSLRRRLDRDYGGRGAWVAIAMTFDGGGLVVPLAAAPTSGAAMTPAIGVLLGTLGGLAIAWGMSCSVLEDRSTPPRSPEVVVAAAAAPVATPAPVAAATPPREPAPRSPAPQDRSALLAGTYAKQFDAQTYRRFRAEVNDSFVDCVREWNESKGDPQRPMAGKTVFVLELDVVPDERVDVDEVWFESDDATMRDLVDCMRHGLETASVEPIVGTLPAQMRVILDGDEHIAVAKPVIDLEGLPDDLRSDRALLDALGGWLIGKEAPPPGAEAAVTRFGEAFADGRIAEGELDEATLEALRAAR